MKTAFITGITGQDGSYLAELLLQEGYQVFGMVRKSSSFNTGRIDHLQTADRSGSNLPADSDLPVWAHSFGENLFLIYGDLTDGNLSRIIYDIEPDEVYNLGAQAHVRVSFDQPEMTMNANAMGNLRLLTAIESLNKKKHVKFYQASCHDAETLVVTSEGIKSYYQIDIGDKVLSINKHNHIEWKPIKRIVISDYTGDMFVFRNRRINLKVTPNHKMMFLHDNGSHFYCRADEASSLFKYDRFSQISLPSPVAVSEESSLLIEFGDYIDFNSMPINCYKNMITNMNICDYFYLLGLYIGDGYTKSSRKAQRKKGLVRTSGFIGSRSRNKRGMFLKEKLSLEDVEYKSNYIHFAIPEEDKARIKLVQTLTKLGIDFKSTPDGIEFSSWALARMFKQSGNNVYEKHIPDWVFGFSSQLIYLYNGIIDSDGHRRAIKHTRESFVTVSKKLAEQMIELCYRIGKVPSLSVQESCNVWFAKENRFIKSRIAYRINVAYKKRSKLYRTNINKEFYNDKVWCLEVVDNSNFLVIRDGKCSFSGNSSEMFGNHPPGTLLNEKSSFYPCSPYAIAKTAAYWQTCNYRKKGIFAVNGVLFNHETVTSFTPMIYKFGKEGEIDIAPISDICTKAGFIVDKGKNLYQESDIDSDLYVWDKKGWTLVKYASAYPSYIQNKKSILINARNAVYSATEDHVIFMSKNKEKLIQDIKVGDLVALVAYPCVKNVNRITLEESRLLGALVGDGCYSRGLRYTSSDINIRNEIIDLWGKVGDGKWSYIPTLSGFTGKEVGQIALKGSGLEWFKRFTIYTKEKGVFGKRYKKVPKQILNSSVDIQGAFLEGYNLADGLKKNPCKYLFKNFKTNSPTLASGLVFLINRVTKQQYNVTVEKSIKWGKTQYYYSINLLSNSHFGQNHRNSPEKRTRVLAMARSGMSQRAIHRETGISREFISKVQHGYVPSGSHLMSRNVCEVKKIIPMDDYNGWFYDLETQSGTFHCGVGQGVVHNSPRRGATYVTRKITRAATRIACGLQHELALGNLAASRDWGYAPDYCRAMYMMMQHNKPDDFVVATGVTKTVQDFLDTVFEKLDLNVSEHVRIDKRYFRDIELDTLKGNSSKIQSTLGWKPSVDFDELVDKMIESDMRLAESEKKCL